MMKKNIQWLWVAILFAHSAAGQNDSGKTYRNFPLVVSLQFHALSFPFKDMKANFRNIGIGIGTEIALGSTHTWAQQFQLVAYRNKQVGSGIILYTQSAWRPTIVSYIYTELKTGFGVTYNFRPVKSFQQINGGWVSVGHKGKFMLTVPLGVSLGYNKFSKNTYVAPFVSYQILANTNYAKGIPVITNSLYQLGSQIHFSSKK